MKAEAEHSAKRIVMLSMVTRSNCRLHCYYHVLTIEENEGGVVGFFCFN